MKRIAVVVVVLLGICSQCLAQDRTSAELDQLLGPIALYPDPLIGIILPASTQPTEIVLASQYLSQGGDTNQIPQQPWDPSVQALAHYPDVLNWMAQNLAWTTQLGQAFLNQQTDVMDSIQRLRTQAQNLGNLPSTAQENVADDDGNIDIEPADPDEMYVPDYEPDEIFDQPGVYCTFGIGLPLGGWLGFFDWDWRHHHLIVWGPGHEHPHDWWQRSPAVRAHDVAAANPTYWRPAARPHGVVAAGGDRGYGEVSRAPARAVIVPATRAPAAHGAEGSRSIPVIRDSQTGRAHVEASRPVERSEPAVSRAVERSEPSESAFGGSQSAREVRESSSRGAASRGFSGGGFSGGGGHSGGGGRR